jgi:8-oxo-dGTP pyrophosphatase MutT (NUDIX family)
VFLRALRDRPFRSKLQAEVWHLFKQKLPARLVTPRSQYVYCHIMMKRGHGRWLPPGSLHLRPCSYGIVFDEIGRVLLVSAPELGFYWALPGGALEPGETLITALEREFEEETGLTVTVGQVVENTDEFAIMPTGTPIHGLLHYYLVSIKGGTLLPQGNGFDTGSVAFMDINSLPADQIGGGETLRRIINRARDLQQFVDNASK